MVNVEKEREKGSKIDLDFENDKFLKEWLEGRPHKTKNAYQYAMKYYALYTALAPEQMLLEKQDDLKKEPMEQGVVESRVKGFFEWLKNDFVRADGKKGMSDSSAMTYVGAIANFYKKRNLRLALNWKEFKATPKAINAREKMTAEQIEKLAYYAPTLRDKAIIWCMFQSGADISTVLSWNWGYLEKEILDPPMDAVMIRDLTRKKELTTFNTLIYKTAIKHLKEYLEERFGKDFVQGVKKFVADYNERAEKWNKKHPDMLREKMDEYNCPLFVGRSGERHLDQYVQSMMREIAPLADIANSRFFHADINPLSPHSLRASFEDQMAKAGANPIFIDYLMGHKVPFKGAYFGGEGGLREAYIEYAEKALEPKGISSDEGLKLKTTVDGLTGMYEEEKKRREEAEERIVKIEKAMEWMLSEIRRFQEETLKRMGDSPEEIEKTMKLAGSKLEDYLK